ncbi:MAG: PAS domain S-box protein [Campylobacterota bacterium]|nr:PAS domain S-box protein [Campylobacterota bacterium]
MENVTPRDEEYLFEGSVAISQTDLSGNMTFANRKFCEISGYKVDELIGSNHNIVRHPDMPSTVFDKMWSTLKSGQAWNGILKNLRKDGSFYWGDTEILPILDDNQEFTGFISVEKNASSKDIKENEEIYKKMLQSQS